MKIFSSSQIRDIDRFTIENEPISSLNLMDRAADAIFRWFAANIGTNKRITIIAGPGNNGGDGMALARILTEGGYNVDVYYLDSKAYSDDFHVNLNRLANQGIVNSKRVSDESQLPSLEVDTVVVDALFGSGLSRALDGFPARLVGYINKGKSQIISIDIPSGLFCEENPQPNINPVIHANVTLSLQFPKFSFLFAENAQFVGRWKVLPIGLHQGAISTVQTPYIYIDRVMVSSMLKPRTKFGHKGSYGHCLIVAGSHGMMGASVLASSACIKSGSGLVTAHVPKVGYSVLQGSIPEVLVDVDENEYCFSGIIEISKYTAIGVGPGIGKRNDTYNGLYNLIKGIKVPLLVDADGLNIIAEHPDLLKILPENTVITPHPGEFDRLFGICSSGHQRLNLALDKAKEYSIIIVLKGANTQIVCPNGDVFFNSTGNPGMATGGSGDVLTGVITSLLGQGYDPTSASIIGVYIHGLAGDLASAKKGFNALTATDIISYLGDAFNLTVKLKDE